MIRKASEFWKYFENNENNLQWNREKVDTVLALVLEWAIMEMKINSATLCKKT